VAGVLSLALAGEANWPLAGRAQWSPTGIVVSRADVNKQAPQMGPASM
jgi:hypothetical protein